MRIRTVTENKKKYLPLLLLADEQESMIDLYLGRGTMYVLEKAGEAKAQCVVTDEGGGVLELKSLSVLPEYQRRGCGRALVEFIAARYAREYSVLRAGTGDSPLTLPFYESCGFTRCGRVKNFFTDNYDHPIYENGVRLRDMIYLQRAL